MSEVTTYAETARELLGRTKLQDGIIRPYYDHRLVEAQVWATLALVEAIEALAKRTN
jgi:hypothetical protein